MACTKKKQCLYGDICPTARSDEYNLIDASCYKPLEQTNEEWFCSLSTEEKAEWLTEFSIRFIPCELIVPSKKIKTYKNNILVWLKQPYNRKDDE